LRALAPWRPRPGAWDPAAAAHLARRAGFGAAPGEVDRLVALGVDGAVDAMFERDEHDPRLLQGVRALLPVEDTDRLAGWWMSLMLAGGAPLRERVTLMWHDHFATSDAKVDDARMMFRQNQLFREAGLGDFRALLHAVAKDPAMLVWLDGGSNREGQPNENFAREVMELFALGIGNYTEADIREAARAFTGWGTRGRSFHLRESDHDPGTKEIFGRRGPFRGEDVIDLILEQRACRRFVARRLLEELVAPDPREEWIDDTAATLVREDWHVGRTIAAILRSELFFSPEARRSRIAGPVELICMTARRLDARVAPQRAAEAAAAMGQSLLRPPSVKGWDGMRSWINAGTWVARHNALVDLARAHVQEVEGVRTDLRAAFGEPGSQEEVPHTVLAALLPGTDPVALVWESELHDAASEADDVDHALALVTGLVLTAPEYHLV
jgi:uncharacterized protein (DUF1800 family)